MVNLFVVILLMFGLSMVGLSADEGLFDVFTCLKLDSQTKELLDYQKEHPDHPKLIEEIPLKILRERPPYEQSKMKEIDTIQTISISGSHGPIPVRLYTPKTDNLSLPVLIYFHGGGWTLGCLDGYDKICQPLAVQSGCLVASVDYHLAPEHPFPIPLQDCYESVKWVSENIAEYKGNPTRIAVGGDSAGGNLAAAVTLMARESNEIHLVYQVLIYPAVSYQFDTLSYELFKENYFLTKDDMKCLWKYYVQGQDRNNPYISPLKASCLNNLPPALLIIADYDVLRDEGLAYGWRLKESNVPITVKRYGSIHGFLGFDSLNVSKQAISDIGDHLKQVLYLKGDSYLTPGDKNVTK